MPKAVSGMLVVEKKDAAEGELVGDSEGEGGINS